MTEEKVTLNVEKNEDNLEFITRDELLAIIATQESLEKIFKIQEVKNPTEVTQEMLDEANAQMTNLATVAQVFQIAGILNETTRDNFTRNLAGLFDTLQIQKLILQKLGATPDIEKEAKEEYLADKKARMEALEEAHKKAEEEAKDKETKEVPVKPVSHVKPVAKKHKKRK